MNLKERKEVIQMAEAFDINDSMTQVTESAVKSKIFAHIVGNQKLAAHQATAKAFFEGVFGELNKELRDKVTEDQEALEEAAPTISTASITGYDPVMISMLRRSVVDTVTFDVVGVQPMTQPTGLIFAFVPRYADDTEAFVTEPNSAYTGTGTQTGTNPTVLNDAVPGPYTAGSGMTTAELEALDDASAGDEFAQMKFTIEKVSVTAKGRGVRAEFSTEMVTDLQRLHGLDAGAIIADLLSQEIVVEQNREVIRKIYIAAQPGAQVGTTVTGTWSIDDDSKGRWVEENVKSFLTQTNRESSSIFYKTKMGRGNFAITTLDIADALSILPNYKPSSLMADGVASVTGTINGKKIIVDPYLEAIDPNAFVSGYKGSSELKAGMYFTPYVAMEYYDAVHSSKFQPTKGVKSRYGLVGNPFATATATALGDGTITANTNQFYTRLKVVGTF